MRMTGLLPAVLALLLGGCSTPTVKAYVEGAKALARDEVATNLENFEYLRCRGIFIGAAMDRFGQTARDWDAYVVACRKYWQAEGVPDGQAPAEPAR